MTARVALAIGVGAIIAAIPAQSTAFPHVVRQGETLAQIAERAYGRVEMEQLLVSANGLEAFGGVPVVAGMRLEIPALSHRRVASGDSWAQLAGELLGDPARGDVLAASNGVEPWIPPAEGAELLVPYNLRYVVGSGDSLLTIAYRFLGDRDKAWMLDKYNHLHQEPVHRGDVVLVPLMELVLTDAGKAEAEGASALVQGEAGGAAREAQKRAAAEVPLLATEVRTGRYVDAVARGNRLLGYATLTREQLALILRALTEAYVALDATGQAETTCSAWLEADKDAKLDPVEMSPKILRACTAATSAPPTLSSAFPAAPRAAQSSLPSPKKKTTP
jgi:hypothetical protein